MKRWNWSWSHGIEILVCNTQLNIVNQTALAWLPWLFGWPLAWLRWAKPPLGSSAGTATAPIDIWLTIAGLHRIVV